MRSFGLRERKVPKLCPTRWNYMYESLVVSYEYRNLINSIFNAHVSNDDGHLTNADWDNVKILVDFLEKFHIATNEFSRQYYPTISNCLVYLAELANLFAYFSEGGEIYEQAIDYMRKKFKKYFSPIPPIYGVAALLNPAMKLGDNARPNVPTPSSSSSQSSKKTVGVRALTAWAGFRGSQGSSTSDCSQLNELEVYLSQGIEEVNPDGSFNILEWWKDKEKHFPIPSRMARDIMSQGPTRMTGFEAGIPISIVLTIQASIVTSDSAFSQTILRLSDYRASMRESLEKSVIFRDWIRSDRRNFGLAESQPEVDESYEEMLAELAEDASSPESSDEQAFFPPPPMEIPPNLEGFMKFVRDTM
ncbi:zinc finger BED domain-containing protein RICESLEEPER 3-like [Nicotiana sylvestris]|uniref:zinc finger BED domain-containing protein RICESLEEPER 3-like n=1 Tax=Nicotiana sylvestris TaxID=4096 RepID=UPI00388CDC72